MGCPARRFCAVSALLLLTGGTRGATQEVRLVAAGAPGAELPYDFTQVTQVVELRDGRVVVVDRVEATLRLADMNTGLSSRLGRTGSGPGEYRIPLWVLPLGGDSVGVYDDAGVRVLVITRDGRIGGFVSPLSPSPGIGRVGARYGDGLGWFYGEGSATTPGPDGKFQRADSAPILRWRIGGTSVERVAFIPRPLPEGAVAVGTGGAIAPGTLAQPGTRNLWSVGSDGRIAIVHPEPFRVDLISPSGALQAGRVIPYSRVPVNDSVKAAFLAEPSAMHNAVVVDGATGKVTRLRARPPRVGSSATMTWVREVPPFRGDAFVAFDPTGALWIQRTTFGREGARYDLVGTDGALIDRVRLPEGHRVVGFGRTDMYVVRRDADDLEYLQRRPLPR